MPCPLCHSPNTREYFSDRTRDYLQCSVCDLVFVDSQFLPSVEQEKQEYDLHQNHINDAGYVRFLEKLLLPVAKRLHAKAKGLDFGSGPQPVLAALFSQRQFEMSHYDPIYHDDKTLFEKTYDFVTASEVVEHFHKPSESWQRMANLLNADGLLGVMTKRVISRERFANWHYKNDKTHVSFYSDETMFWLAQKFGWDCELISSDVVLFTVNRDE